MARLNRDPIPTLEKRKRKPKGEKPSRAIAIYKPPIPPVVQDEPGPRKVEPSTTEMGKYIREKITPEYLVGKIQSAMEFVEMIRTKDGKIVPVLTPQAVSIQLRAQELAHHLRNDYPPTGLNVSGNLPVGDPRPIRVEFIKPVNSESSERNEDES
jgi:hypothetical protein